MRRIRILTLIMMLLVAFSCVSFAAEANAKVTVKTKKIDKTRKYANGEIKNYAKYVQVSGKTTAIKKINKALKKEAKQYLWSESEMDSYEEAYYDRLNTPDQYGFNLLQETTEKTGYNKNNILSVSLSNYNYGGGAHGYGEIYGMTYNVKTGKKLTIGEVVPKKYDPRTASGYKKLKALMVKKVKAKYENYPAESFEGWCTREKLKEMDFYINKSGKVVACVNNGVFGGNYSATETFVVVKSKF